MNLGDGPVERTDLRNDNSYNILSIKGIIRIGYARKCKNVSALVTYHKPMVIHVQDQILTHHSQTNESNIRSVESII